MEAESYVVRIYRRGSTKRQSIVGVIEAVNSGWQKPFQSFAELAEILAMPDVPLGRGGSRDGEKGET